MKLIRRSYVLFYAYSIIAFASVMVSPATFWLSGILSLSILPCLVINLLFAFYYLFRKRWKWLAFSLSLFVIGYAHVGKTLSIHRTGETGNLKVMSFNVRIFNLYFHLRDEEASTSKKMIEWVTNSDADIMILQEFYDSDSSMIWNALHKITKTYPHVYFERALRIGRYNQFGQVIFSRYPIINKGKIAFDNRTLNQAIFADVVVHNDTIRVYNAHLESMKIEEKKLFDEDAGQLDELKQKVRDTFKKLLGGFENRAHQINNITQHMETCPYPMIMGADMNDTPYSYTYSQLRKTLKNAFEERGNGFGFTFNGKLFFLRIDNLFSSDQLEINTFQVHRDMPYSDHFPISATYSINK